MQIRIPLILCLLVTSACATTPPSSASPEMLDASVIVLADMLRDSYPSGNTSESKPLAICFPEYTDPSQNVLSNLATSATYPCSSLEGSPPDDPPKISSTGEGAIIFSVEKIEQTDANNARIFVSTFRGAFNDAGHIYTLHKAEGVWKIVSKWRDWVQ